MRTYAFLILIALLPAGCGPSGVTGTAYGGVVNPGLSAEAQQAAADGHCRRVAKAARLGVMLDTGSIMFDCVR